MNSYLEGQDLLNQRKAGSTNKRRKRETIGYVLEQQIDSHAVHYEDTEGIEAKVSCYFSYLLKDAFVPHCFYYNIKPILVELIYNRSIV